jgi:hypothetical protein
MTWFIRTKRLWRLAVALGAGLFLEGLPAAANAAPVYTITTQAADLGTVTASATGDTVFRVDPNNGSVTTISGTATRQNNSATRAVVTISCAASAPDDCTKNVNVRLGSAGAVSGRARALSRIVFIMGTAQLFGGPGPPGSGSFTLAPIGPNASKTFFVGADFPIAGDDSGLPTGLAEADFFVFAAESPGAPTTGATGRFLANVIRSIAISKTSDLVFGRVIKPLSGGGTVTIDATSGARTFDAGVQGLDSPTPGRAAFNVTGEGGQTFSVSLPATFQMTGPAPITVTTTSSVPGTATLSSSLGSSGSFTFGVGGSAPITASTQNGDYSGSFIVTVAYN